MSIFESILYGLVSGFAEFLPVSSQGHQAIMMQLFGMDAREPLRDMIVHVAILIALLTTCKPVFSRVRQEHLIATRSRRRKKGVRRAQYDLQLIKTAAFPLLAGFLIYIATRSYEFSPVYLALFLCINGIILIVPEYIRHGNKDARFMTGWDGIFLGLLGALSALPGISRIGIMSAYCTGRGSDRQQALNWLLVLSAPILILFLGFDIFNLFTYGFGTFSFGILIGYILSGVMAYIGGYFGIVIIRFLTVRTGYAGFAYYSWGAALFCLVLYLIA